MRTPILSCSPYVTIGPNVNQLPDTAHNQCEKMNESLLPKLKNEMENDAVERQFSEQPI